jgi:predicted SnoaL-like aldol condensation-catalyzing enzyme
VLHTQRKDPLMENDGKALVRRLFDEVFTSENLAAADEIMAERYVEHAIAPFGREEPGQVHGPSHAREVVQWLTDQFPDLEMTIESLIADGDMVAIRVRSSGTNSGKLGRIRSAHQPAVRRGSKPLVPRRRRQAL